MSLFMNAVDLLAAPARRAFALTVMTHTYNDVPLDCFVRGFGSEDIWPGAMQQDLVAVVDTLVWAAALPTQPEPKRFDKMLVGGRTFTVQEWRGAPQGQPVFYKILIRGGSQ